MPLASFKFPWSKTKVNSRLSLFNKRTNISETPQNSSSTEQLQEPSTPRPIIQQSRSESSSQDWTPGPQESIVQESRISSSLSNNSGSFNSYGPTYNGPVFILPPVASSDKGAIEFRAARQVLSLDGHGDHGAQSQGPTLEEFRPQHILEDIITNRNAFSSSTTSPDDEEAPDCYMPLETQTVMDSCVTIQEKLVSKTLTVKNIKTHLPRAMLPHIKKYMTHMVIGGQNYKAALIALWNPSPDRRNTDSDLLLLRKRISPGCVGYFNATGGFHVLFNVLRTGKQNEDLGYKVPLGYKQFAKDDCTRTETISPQARYQYGFTNESIKGKGRSNENQPLMSLSVLEQAPKHAVLYLPHGAIEETFSPEMKEGIEAYITNHGRSWYIQCNSDPKADKRYPILIHSVWLAKSFACATYMSPGHKSRTGRHAVLSGLPDQDRMMWTVDDGIHHMKAPLDTGYDKDGRLISQDESQCFALSAYQICPESLMERSGALLSPGARRRSNVTF